jgi:hypothetical protein
MIEVKNLNGTTDNDPPEGYSTWKEFWEDKKEKDFSTCSCKDCSNDAEVGAHVKKANSSDNKWYIVPLCTSCNHKTKDEVFEVREYDLVPVNQ